jgi:hypothetical protein
MDHRHPGDYKEKRLGLTRADWNNCDHTPCRCSKGVQRIVKGAYKAQLRDYLKTGALWDGTEDFCQDELEDQKCQCEGCQEELARMTMWSYGWPRTSPDAVD